MRSAATPLFLDCPLTNANLPAFVCKVVKGCVAALSDLTSVFRASYHDTARDRFAEFDWRLNELVYDDKRGHLPRRAWMRHSAVLTMARQSCAASNQSAKQECVIPEACVCNPVHCSVCEITTLPIWATNYADIGLINEEIRG